jgi:8-oxo-dGTP pyrophosphatase MutT (NUDIX family)
MRNKTITPVVAGVIVRYNPTQLLLHQKNESHDEKGIARNPELCGKWEFAGGMMEYGETPEQTLEREIREELGVQITDPMLIHAQTNIYKDKKHYLVLYYICLTDCEATPEGCKWVSPEDVPAMDCLPTTYMIAEKYRFHGVSK